MARPDFSYRRNQDSSLRKKYPGFVYKNLKKYYKTLHMTNIILMKSKRGGMIILYDYFMYNFDRIVSAEKRWRCQNRRRGSVLYTSIENEFSRCTDHNHLKDINKAKAHVVRMKIK
ncbi:hypothetical protein DMUE_0077 [Dictyocoela muelleri]|nr:hypothetical protein DMUE_0077 [Dictyocoela muelleri]